MDQQQPPVQKEFQALQLLGLAADKYIATLDDLARPVVAAKLQEAANVLVAFLGDNGVPIQVAPAEPSPLPPAPSPTAENSQ